MTAPPSTYAPEPGRPELAEVNGRPVLLMSDRSVLDLEQITTHLLSNPTHPFTKEYLRLMSTTQNLNTCPDDRPSHWDLQNADSAHALLAFFDPSIAGAMLTPTPGSAAARDLNNLRWNARIGDVVTLDTEPEVPGKPQSGRPGVPAVALVRLPDTARNARSVAVLWYDPVETTIAQSGREYAKLDAHSLYAVVRLLGPITDAAALELLQELRRAVWTLGARTLGSTYEDGTPEERAPDLGGL